ncbi:MAG: SUMF1/EgtB/PvdO family nonheme iron enzyme [Rhodobacteraceae bacterium]|nr:SUMF1/EgtB/PvdO family nonheme iron enzyme [Paracoccaceae bacterium]
MTFKSNLLWFLALLTGGAAALVLGLVSSSPKYTGELPETVDIPGGSYSYRIAGQFRIGTHIVDAPVQQRQADLPLTIMKYPVSQTEYAACVTAGACKVTDVLVGNNMPQTGINFYDAISYATWFSKTTKQHWRLPTDEEWTRAAGDRYHDDALGDPGNADDPAQRWIENYRAQTITRGASEPELLSRGSYGENNLGVADISGNIWEWTDTCYRSGKLTINGQTILTSSEYCGVRAAQGKHRAYIIEFVRDAKVGGCAVGIPPDYLGFRLVLDNS